MKLEEMKAIAEKRTPGKWNGLGATSYQEIYHYHVPYPEDGYLTDLDEQFIIMASNNWDKLMAVVEPIKFIIEHEPEQLKELNDWKFGSAWDEIRTALEELEKE